MPGIIGLAVAVVAAHGCDARENEVQASDSAAVCLERLSVSLKSQMDGGHSQPDTENMQWVVRANIEGGKASVEIHPGNPHIRGGGARYEFDCTTQELKLIEAYR